MYSIESLNEFATPLSEEIRNLIVTQAMFGVYSIPKAFDIVRELRIKMKVKQDEQDRKATASRGASTGD